MKKSSTYRCKKKKKKKEKILEAAQCPLNDLQRENPSCRNTRRLLYKLPLLEEFGGRRLARTEWSAVI